MYICILSSTWCILLFHRVLRIVIPTRTASVYLIEYMMHLTVLPSSAHCYFNQDCICLFDRIHDAFYYFTEFCTLLFHPGLHLSVWSSTWRIWLFCRVLRICCFIEDCVFLFDRVQYVTWQFYWILRISCFILDCTFLSGRVIQITTSVTTAQYYFIVYCTLLLHHVLHSTTASSTAHNHLIEYCALHYSTDYNANVCDTLQCTASW